MPQASIIDKAVPRQFEAVQVAAWLLARRTDVEQGKAPHKGRLQFHRESQRDFRGEVTGLGTSAAENLILALTDAIDKAGAFDRK
jgi:hypothetical protein